MRHGVHFVHNGEVRGANYHEQTPENVVLTVLCNSERKQSQNVKRQGGEFFLKGQNDVEEADGGGKEEEQKKREEKEEEGEEEEVGNK